MNDHLSKFPNNPAPENHKDEGPVDLTFKGPMNKDLRQHALGFWEVSNKPDSDELKHYYATKYYQEALGSYEHSYSADELRYFDVRLEQRLAVMLRERPQLRERTRLLDVGCGEGYTLAFFRRKAWDVKGFDFSNAGVLSKNPDCINSLQTGNVFELLQSEIASGRTYHVVWLQNVLEHVIEPVELMSSLRRLITNDGLLIVTVPNDFSITQLEALRLGHIDEEFWVAIPDHLQYFNAESVTAVGKATGWNCLEMLGDFPIDWFLFHQASNYVKDRKVGKASHLARIQLENLLHRQPIDDVIRFQSALARMGLGRNLTAFFAPES